MSTYGLEFVSRAPLHSSAHRPTNEITATQSTVAKYGTISPRVRLVKLGYDVVACLVQPRGQPPQRPLRLTASAPAPSNSCNYYSLAARGRGDGVVI